MKIRYDFVTNSSSSSFIMAFYNKGGSWKDISYPGFLSFCEWLNYEDFARLISQLAKDPKNTDKNKALELLLHAYTYEYRRKLLNEAIKESDFDTYGEYLEAQRKLEESEGFKKKIQDFADKNDEYQEKKKAIEDADLVVQGMVWDTGGGILEWAIRKGFIEDNFPKNHILTWNVG